MFSSFLVLHRIYELIGMLSREYPDCITADFETIRIKDMFLLTLEKSLLNQEEVNLSSQAIENNLTYCFIFLDNIRSPNRCSKWLPLFPRKFQANRR